MEETAEVAVPLHRLEVPAPQILPFAIGSFDSIGPMSRAGFPHRHTFHEIVYVTGGRGDHVIDLCRRPVTPPNLCFIAPGQVHHWEGVRELTGWVVLFDDAFLLAHPSDRDTLRGLGERPWRRLDPPTAAEVAPLLAEMVLEYRAQRPGMVSVLQAYLHILLVRAARPHDPPPRPTTGEPTCEPTGESTATHEDFDRAGEEPAQVGPSPAVAALSRRFAELLAREGPAPGHSVRELAGVLGVSVSYLSEAVKAATGRTPAQLVRDAQVLEAKRLLSGTDLTVQRVARDAGFADAAYFCRFFRRETGLSPGEFRRAVVRNHHAPRSLSIDA